MRMDLNSGNLMRFVTAPNLLGLPAISVPVSSCILSFNYFIQSIDNVSS